MTGGGKGRQGGRQQHQRCHREEQNQPLSDVADNLEKEGVVRGLDPTSVGLVKWRREQGIRPLGNAITVRKQDDNISVE